MTIRILHGDMLYWLPTLPENSIDSAVVDGPYNLDTIRKRFGSQSAAAVPYGTDGAYSRASAGFMGHEWDNEIMENPVAWWHLFRVLKPGAHLLSFSHARTYHRMTMAIEQAGFEIRDQIMWLYGSGFPKRKTMLKPAHEPICVARKPLSESSIAANMALHGVGGLNIEGSRVPSDDTITHWGRSEQAGKSKGILKDFKAGETKISDKDRYPSNVIHDGLQTPWAKFFYCAKTPGKERPWSCKDCGAVGGSNKPKTCSTCGGDKINSHPTIKPQLLMRYLCRLVTPPGGTVIDPYAGTGSTLQAARDEGFNAIGIEKEDIYVKYIQERLK